MKFSCTRDNIHQGLSIVSHLTAKNTHLPILQNVLIKAENGSLSLTSTNLEIAIRCILRGKMDVPGEFTIPSKLFFDYVSLLPNDTVHVELSENDLLIKCGTFKTKIRGMEASEFPLVPSVVGDQTYQIPVGLLREGLARVLFAVTSNESRPELTGVCMRFELRGTTFSCVLASTDSYRLAETVIPLAGEGLKEGQVIIPAKTLAEVSRVLSVFKDEVTSPETIRLSLTQNQAVFSFGPVELVSRVIEGKYPDYTQVIPKQFQTTIEVDGTDFAKAVKTASLFSRQNLFDVTLRVEPETKQIAVFSLDASRGENTTMCDAVITGVQNTFTVNFRYLLDGLNALPSDRAILQLIDASNPCLMTPKDGSQPYQYLIMPIRQ